MRTYTYRARIEPGEEAGLVVSFPDVPEAITQGDNEADARAMAAEALGLALLMYLKERRPLPKARVADQGLVPITVDPEDAAKIAVLEAFRDANLSQVELARKLGKDPREVRRILDPMHATKLPALKEALAALGRRLVISVEEIAV